MSWDAYIDMRGRCYCVTAQLVSRSVQIRLTLDGELAVYDGEQLAVVHQVSSGEPGWVNVLAHHATLWAQTLEVKQRPLAVYEEVAS